MIGFLECGFGFVVDGVYFVEDHDSGLFGTDLIEDIVYYLDSFMDKWISSVDDMQQDIAFYTIFEGG